MNQSAGSLAILLSTVLLTGCATGQHPRDPLENLNRAVFTFNDKVDQVALKPAATVYQDILPEPVQIAVGNFFGNINDVWTGANHMLQGNVENGLSDFMRVAVNTMLGFGGLIDLASAAGIPKHQQDFGTTLGVWGMPAGPYVVLPLLGPYTMRDTVAAPVDIYGDPWVYVEPLTLRNTGYVIRLIDKRAALLSASNLIEDAALDRYGFVRDAFLQRREDKVEESKKKGSGGVWEDAEGEIISSRHHFPHYDFQSEPEPSLAQFVVPSRIVFQDADESTGTVNADVVHTN